MQPYPSRYVVVDTESTERRSSRREWDKEQVFRLGCAKLYDPEVYGENKPVYHGFEDPREFLTLLKMIPCSTEKVWVFAHNLGYDLRMLGWFDWVTDGEFTLFPPKHHPQAHRYQTPLMAMDGHPTMMRFFRPDGQQFLLMDSFNWLPVKLEAIGEWIGFPKGKVDHETASDEEVMQYCFRDVDLLDRALRKLWGWMQCVAIPDFSFTPAAASAQIYRLRYAKKRIVRPETPEPLHLDRLAYYGGIVECFFVGRYKRQTYQVDVNGLYPKVMRDNPYPAEILDHDLSPLADHDPDSIPTDQCTAEVWLDSPEIPYPVRGSDGTLWVRGRVRTVLAGPELHRAYRLGHVRKVGRWVRFRMDMLFDAYVNTFWKLRLKAQARGDTLIDKVCKSLLNSLHGKFGQRDGVWQYEGRTAPHGSYLSGKVIGAAVKGQVESRSLDGHFFTRCRDQEHDAAFVPIAAWCASYARVYMDEMIDIAGRGNCLYQCIDSLVATQDGWDRLMDARLVDTGELGAFKFEDTFQWIDIQSINQIDTDTTSKHAGIKSGSAVVADGIYEVEEWESLSGTIFDPKSSVSSVLTRKVIKRPSREYSRRYVNVDGITIPWRIDNWKIPPEKQSDISVRSLARV